MTRAALTILLLLATTSALAAPVGRVDGSARERFDLRGLEAPRTRLLLAPGGATLTPAAEGEPVVLAVVSRQVTDKHRGAAGAG